jgi:hypothetical protein
MNKTTTPAAVQSSNKGLGSIGKFGCQSKYFAVPEFDYSCTTIMDSSKGLRHVQLLLENHCGIGWAAAVALCEVQLSLYGSFYLQISQSLK